MRHGKSSWDDPRLGDDQRPLKKRGRKDAAVMAEWMKSRGIIPDRIVSSHANRAASTAEIVRESMGLGFDVEHDERLYFEGLAAYLQILNELPEDVGCILMAGHNPDSHNLVEYWSGKDLYNFPTAGVAVFEWDLGWADIEQNSKPRCLFIERPSEHR